MPTYAFKLILAGHEANKEDRSKFRTGILCDDSQIGSVPGITRRDFRRDAPDYKQAVMSAVHDLKRDAPELEVLRWGSDDPFIEAAVRKSVEEWLSPQAKALMASIKQAVEQSKAKANPEVNPN